MNLILCILVFSIVSLDSHHIDECENKHCSLCNIIHFSQKVILAIMASFVMFSIMTFFVAYYLAELYEKKHNEVVILNSLVYRKIQFNE